MPPDVSLITVYYNTPEELQSLYASVQKFLPAGQYEFLIADNDSKDDLSARLSEAKYLRLTENFGFAKANNIAAKQASGRYLFFINPDCRFINNPLPELLLQTDANTITAPRVLNDDGSIQLSFGPALSIWNEFRQRSRVQNESSARIQREIEKETAAPFSPGFVGGCALMISADLYHQLGGFDEHFFLYEEDVDLCKRAADQGAKILYVPSASIVHLRNRSVAKEPRRTAVAYRQSQIYYYRKHHGWFQNALLKIYLMLKFAFQPAIRKMIWKDEVEIEQKKLPLH